LLFGRLLIPHSLRGHFVDELVRLWTQPLLVALTEQRDRLPRWFAVGAAELVRAVQSVLGVLDGGVPDFLLDLIRNDGALIQVLDTVREAVELGAGAYQPPLEGVHSGILVAVAVRGEQAPHGGDPLPQSFLVGVHGFPRSRRIRRLSNKFCRGWRV